jgi:hypothetical protein
VFEVQTILMKMRGIHNEEFSTHVFGMLSSIIGVSGPKPASFRISRNVILNASLVLFLSSLSLARVFGITAASFMYASIAFDGDRRSLPMRITTSLYTALNNVEFIETTEDSPARSSTNHHLEMMPGHQFVL